MIDLRENLGVAMDTLRSHKVRSALTVLGIVIGVTSVISVAAIITGLNRYIQDKVNQFGPNTFFLSRIPPSTSGRMPEKIRMRRYFDPGDAARLREICPAVRSITMFGTRAAFLGNSNQIRYGGQLVDNGIVRGVDPDYADVVPLFSVQFGRFISRYDDEHSTHVVVLGADIADALFPNVDPLGKAVRINGRNFEVIGVFTRTPGLFGGPGVDQFAIMPFTTFHKEYPEAKELAVGFELQPDIRPDAGVDQVVDAMRRIRHLHGGQENDFEVIGSDFLSTLWNQLTGAMVILTV